MEKWTYSRETLLQFITITLILTGCGGASTGTNPTTTPTSSPSWNSYVVASTSNLPTCEGDIVGRLYYVESSQGFYTCRTSGWSSIILGSTIETNRLINPSATDFCTYSNETCFFNGGQFLRYSDGSVLIMGGLSYSYITSTSGEEDSIIDTFSGNVLLPPAATEGWIRLSPYVDRGSGFRTLFLHYTRSGDVFRLILDTNQNGTPQPTVDTILLTATLSNW